VAGGNNSVFRINVDGVSGTDFSDIDIAPRDSIYVFVEATLNPNNLDSILLQKDSIVTRTNGIIQDIDVVAWGQDVHMIRGEVLETQTWVNDKPYLIIDYVYVDSLETLTIEPGVRIFLHRAAVFYVGGTLIAESVKEEPIIFSGDRLEKMYEDIPGQWGGIYFLQGSLDNVIDNTIVRGGNFGIVADSVMNENPTLKISNSLIAHKSSLGIVGRGAVIHGYNNIIADCGSSALALIFGGSYEFYHCTIANNYRWSPPRREPTVFINNYYVSVNKTLELRDIVKAEFGNCIIYGNLESEVYIDKDPLDEGVLNYNFINCLTKINDTLINLNDASHFSNIINNQEPRFLSWNNYDFQLDTLSVSPAKDKGLLSIGERFPLDFNGVSRIEDGMPDIGAFEQTFIFE
jgi:hypothetical protein